MFEFDRMVLQPIALGGPNILGLSSYVDPGGGPTDSHRDPSKPE